MTEVTGLTHHPREGWSEGRDPATDRRVPPDVPGRSGSNRPGRRPGRLRLVAPPARPPLPGRPRRPSRWPSPDRTIRSPGRSTTPTRPSPAASSPRRTPPSSSTTGWRTSTRRIVNNFAKKYNCKVEITTFNTMTEAVSKLSSGQFDFDVFVPTVDVLGQLVAAKLVRPLNHSYIPNISQAWTQYQNPFYDQAWQYTVPYTIYTTGIAWRKDHVPGSPADLANPWSFLWNAKYKGKVAILDDYRESLALGMMKNGAFDPNTTDTAVLDAATNSLLDLDKLVNLHIDNNDYTSIPNGQTWIHHAWSGDMAAAANYMPKGTPVDVVGYWFPSNGIGPVANDTMTVAAGGKNPVLAHLFLNYMPGPPQRAGEHQLQRVHAADQRGDPPGPGQRGDPAAQPDLDGGAARPTSTPAPSSSSWPPPSTPSTSRPGSGSAAASDRRRLVARGAPAVARGRPASWTRRAQNRWVWAGFAMPGIIWLVLLVPGAVLRRAGHRRRPAQRHLRVARGGVEPPALDRGQLQRRLPRPGRTGIVRRAHLPAHPGLRGHRLGAVPAHRLSGGLLRDPVRRPPQGPLPGPAHRPVLDQLHDADAGLDRPAPDRRLRQPGPASTCTSSASRSTGWAAGRRP